MEYSEILYPLFEKGLLKESMDLAEQQGLAFKDVAYEGMNFVTAALLADVPSVDKPDLIRSTGALFSSQEYCSLLNENVFTIHPETRDKLKEQGVVLTNENIREYSNWYNIFDIAFPWLPLSVFEDFVLYMREEKNLVIDKETCTLVKENFLNSKRYSERELNAFFEQPIFDEEI